jgi:hypothetical protein
MQCPNCRAACSENDLHCRNCGGDLAKPSTSLVPTHRHLPTVLTNLRLQRLAAGVGVLAASAGLELLRRTLLARLAKPTRPVTNALLTLNGVQDLLIPQVNKNLPRGYEVHETIVYMRRVIRREH